MRRAVTIFSLAALLLGLAGSQVAYAQDEEQESGGTKDDRDPGMTTRDDDQTDNPRNRRGNIRRRGLGRPTLAARGGGRQLPRRLERLHQAMGKELSLHRGQAERIDTLFEDYLGTIKQGPAHRGPDLSPDERARFDELRSRAKKAREAGDQAALEEVREQLRGSMQAWRPSQMKSVDEFAHAVEQELDKSQVREYRKLLQRFRIGGYADRPSAGLRRMAKAVRRPEVNLSGEQRRSVVETIRQAQKKLEAVEDDDTAASEVIENTRTEIVKVLSSKQRKRFKNALMQAEAQEQVRRPAGRERRRVAEPGVHESPTDEDAETPDDSETDDESEEDDG